jgi:hypothetical protein
MTNEELNNIARSVEAIQMMAEVLAIKVKTEINNTAKIKTMALTIFNMVELLEKKING